MASLFGAAGKDPAPIPNVVYDHVWVGPNGPGQFVTSDQCMSCHDGQGKPFGPNMYILPTDKDNGVNLSPYGEWNWSMGHNAPRMTIKPRIKFHERLPQPEEMVKQEEMEDAIPL